MSEEQTFRSEVRPFRLQMANLKFQNMGSAIFDLKFRALARLRYSRFAPHSRTYSLTAESAFKNSYLSSDVQKAHLVALTGTLDKQ
jgi:hypothetical protein